MPLSEKVKECLSERGINELYPPQEEAIRKGVLKGKNLVVSSPTASGKTLIAELAILKKLTEGGGKALYLTPLRALASEKYSELNYYSKLGLKVVLTTGDYDSSDPWLSDYDIIITTNEKADSLLRHKVRWIKEVKVVVADEVHLVNEPKRGPTLEMVLAKLLHYLGDLQIIALSATIRNAEEIARWLNAELVISEWRPVPLKEGVLYGDRIYYGDGRVGTGASLSELINESIREGGQVLVFAGTRHRAVRLANKLSESVRRVLGSEERELLVDLARKLLKAERNSVVEQLAKCVRYGVAFHHAGLTYRVRNEIEEGFRGNLLKVIVATPTLAAGVNLPARKVVIYDYRRYDRELGIYEDIPVMEYKQMCLPYSERILLANGKELEIGRLVEEILDRRLLTFNLDKGHLEASPIVAYFKSKVDKIYVISLDDGREIRLTGNHRVLRFNKGGYEWIEAKRLAKGDEVVTLTDGSLEKHRVGSLEVEEGSKEITVYNLSLLYNNNYFVNGLLVHNCGRAGRPRYDKIGEALLVARREEEVTKLLEQYVKSPPEPVMSKLASEPSLRSHILALIATEGPLTPEEINAFISKTFYATQYPLGAIKVNVSRVINFLKGNSFIYYDEGELDATYLGKRVSELYIDPLTAVTFIRGLKSKLKVSELGYLHLISLAPEIPPLYLRRGEVEEVERELNKYMNVLLVPPPEDPYEYEIYLAKFKVALLLRDWVEEAPEDSIIRKYDVGPGDLYSIVQVSEWLLYSAYEISKVLGLYEHLIPLLRLRERVKEGVKEELLELTRIKGIGRVRARVLYNHGYKNLEDLRRANVKVLASLPTIGSELARRIKEYAEKGEGELIVKSKEETTLDDYF